MSTKKSPLTLKLTGDEIKSLRKKLSLNQLAFWAPLGLTQSAGSRYESGQNIPAPTAMLIQIVYLSQNPSDDLQAHKKVWALSE